MTELMVTEKEFKMTSLDLAKITGKRHSDVMRDIRDEIEKLEKSGINERIFEIIEYKDKKGEKRPMYIIYPKGLKIIAHRYKNIKNNDFYKILKENGIILDTFHTKTRFENSFCTTLKEALNELGVIVFEQYVVKKYRIDFYIPRYNLALEYDEKQHKYKKTEDKTREKEIKKELNCSFIRLDYKKSDIVNVVKVLKEIM